MRGWPLSRVTRNMPLPSASCTSPSISNFSSATISSYTKHAPRGPHVSSRSLLDVDRLRALLALALLVLDSSILLQRLEAVAGDVRVMDEEVLSTPVGRDEAVTLRVVEPLHGSGCHRNTPPLTHDRTGREAPASGTLSGCRLKAYLARLSVGHPVTSVRHRARPDGLEQHAPSDERGSAAFPRRSPHRPRREGDAAATDPGR